MSEWTIFQQGLLRYLSREELIKLSHCQIGIAGAGGLGSNCAHHLVRCGFQQFVLVDYDQVDPSNLNRQFFFQHQLGKTKVDALMENLLQINSDLDIEGLVEKVTPENIDRIFKECDVIVEAFDDGEAKIMLIEHFSRSSKLVVAASGIAGHGESDAIITKKINDNLYIIGDFVSESSADLPPFSPRVSVAAAKQADIILNHILSKD